MATETFTTFQKRYLAIYALMMISDGFRGPFLYPLYKSVGWENVEIYQLFLTTYLSSAVFSGCFGYLADKWSKKYTTWVACIIDAVSCLCRFSSNYQLLVFGHILSGISFCVLLPTLESWMVEEHHHLRFSHSDLQETMTRSSWIFSTALILSGFFGNLWVGFFGYVSLLFLSLLFMLVAIGLIPFLQVYSTKRHHEYPEMVSTEDSVNADAETPEEESAKKPKSVFSTKSFTDPRVLLVGLMQFGYDSALQIFISAWAPMMDHAMKASYPGVATPYGNIFSTFMISSIIGSKIYSVLVKKDLKDLYLLGVVFTVSLASFAIPVIIQKSAPMLLLGFIAYEVSFGIYLPAIGTVRSDILPEENRTLFMNLIKIPSYLMGALGFYFMIQTGNESVSSGTFLGLCGMVAISLASSVVLSAINED